MYVHADTIPFVLSTDASMLHSVTWSLHMQIQTCKQHAILIVHSYPSIPQKGRLLELLASQRGEPPKEVLMQSAGLDNLQHAANWQQVVDYLCGVNAGNINQHVQLFAE